DRLEVRGDEGDLGVRLRLLARAAAQRLILEDLAPDRHLRIAVGAHGLGAVDELGNLGSRELAAVLLRDLGEVRWLGLQDTRERAVALSVWTVTRSTVLQVEGLVRFLTRAGDRCRAHERHRDKQATHQSRRRSAVHRSSLRIK